MRKLRYLLLLTLLGVIGFGIWRGFTRSDYVKVHEIVIEGASKETEARIRKNLNIKAGDALWNFPVDKVAENIKKDGWVETVELRRQFPGTLVISVNERKPFAVVNGTQGRFTYVDANNTVIDKADPDKISDFPVLSGMQFQLNKDLRAKAIELLKNLPEDGLLSRSDISDVSFDNDRGYQLTLSKSRLVIDIGKEDLPLHVDRARRVAQYLAQHSINASRIDSDYAKKVLVKVRKDR